MISLEGTGPALRGYKIVPVIGSSQARTHQPNSENSGKDQKGTICGYSLFSPAARSATPTSPLSGGAIVVMEYGCSANIEH